MEGNELLHFPFIYRRGYFPVEFLKTAYIISGIFRV
jgi:hypothetical protein